MAGSPCRSLAEPLSATLEPELIYVYESQGADPLTKEWDTDVANCECGKEYRAVYHVPTYLKAGRLRCPGCLRYRAVIRSQATSNDSGRVH